jgi:hypothetical protein
MYEPEADKINEWEGFFAHKPSWMFAQFLNDPAKVRCWFTGNQFGKNENVSQELAMTILGIHPVESRNIRPDTKFRMIRCASETLPNDPDGGEANNTQYPVLKRKIPASLIKKDITKRNTVMTIRCPQGGPDIYIEFTGYNQSVQRQAGVQRFAIWLDESAPKAFYEEQLPRLLAAAESGYGGYLIYSLTPAEFLSWEFDTFFDRAGTFYRTQAIVDRVKLRQDKNIKRIEHTDGLKDISIFQAASDDNPTMSLETIEENNALIDDEDVIDIRRFGLFRQVSGLIFKDFNKNIHPINLEKYFPIGIPHGWLHVRLIDYHELNPWACVFVALSPTNEMYVYDEFDANPDKFVTLEIATRLAQMSGDYKYVINLIDPLAAKKQPNTSTSVIEDLNRIFYELSKERIGTGGYWKSWDTKSTHGREALRGRLKNSLKCGKPNNNIISKGYLPTIWVSERCRNTILSLKNWKREEWGSRDSLVTKDKKDKPQQKWSHYCMPLEAILKHSAFKPRTSSPVSSRQRPQYFKGRR